MACAGVCGEIVTTEICRLSHAVFREGTNHATMGGKEGGGGGILNHFSHEIPPRIVVESSNGSLNALNNVFVRLSVQDTRLRVGSGQLMNEMFQFRDAPRRGPIHFSWWLAIGAF